MALIDKLIFTAADYKIILKLQSGVTAGGYNVVIPYTAPLFTAESISTNISYEDETFYAVGSAKPIAEKRNGKKFTGTLTIQAGEMAAILLAAGLPDATEIQDATLAITAPAFLRVYTGLNINTESLDVKAKDKQTLVKLDWKAMEVTGV